MSTPGTGATPNTPTTLFDVVLDEGCTCTFETYDVPVAAPAAAVASAPSAGVDETDETVAAMLDALEMVDDVDEDEDDEDDAPVATDTHVANKAPADVAPPVEEPPKRRGWPQRLKRAVNAMTSTGDQTPAVYADPVMAGVTPTFTKLLVQSFERRGLKGKWVTLEHATPYGDLPPGKLRLLQMDVYEVKSGLEMTSDGTKYIVPAGRFTHYIVRGPVERNGYCAHSAKLGQQVTFDPNVG
jgi:hypothetical protein